MRLSVDNQRHLLILIGAALMWACFFPLNWGWLSAVALLPLFALVRWTERRPLRSAGLIGFASFLASLQWLRVAHPMMHLTWIALAIYCALYVVLAVWLTRRIDRSIGNLMITAPIVWVACDFLRGTIAGGFAWYFLGHAVHDSIPLIQLADITGVYGLTFVLVMVNAWGYETLARLFQFPGACSRRAWLISTPVVIAAVAGTVIYGYARLQHEPFGVGPRVALIQGNLSQDIKHARNQTQQQAVENAIETMLNHHVELSNQAASMRPAPDLIIWPETSYPFSWAMLPEQRPESMTMAYWDEVRTYRDTVKLRLGEMARAWQSAVLFGLNSRSVHEDGREKRWNTALLVDRTGQPIDVYHKMHRVPFGEYVPFKKSLPFMKWFTPYDFDYGIEAGTAYTRFPLKVGDRNYTFGTVICYEDSDPTLAREYNPAPAQQQNEARRANGLPVEPVDFLVNISNDGWFKGTEEHEQHLAIARFRAVESRRSLVRAVNMGISAIIDPDGRVVALPGETWATSKKFGTVLAGEVPIDTRSSLYAAYGDWLALACLALTMIGFLFSWRKRNA